MAKQSAVDKIVARLDGDIARLQQMGNYVAQYPSFDSIGIGKQIDKDVDELRKMRDYVTRDGAGEAVAAPTKQRKPRKKPGLPPAAHEQ